MLLMRNRWTTSQGYLRAAILLAALVRLCGSSTLAASVAPPEDASAEPPTSADVTASASAVVGTKYLVVSSYNCTIPGCQYEDAVVRYSPPPDSASSGSFAGVHASPIVGAYGMVTHPRTGRLLIANSDANTVTEHDARTGALLRTFVQAGAGGLNAPQNLVFNAAGNLLVTSTPYVTTPSAVNGILEFNGDTGAFIRVFINGGTINPMFPEDCGDPRCIRGASGMAFGPNGNLYVASNINHSLLEFNGTTGAYVGVFAAIRLVAPIGLAIRPGPLRPGNIIATSQWDDPNSTTDFQKLVEFDKTTRLPVAPNAGVIASGVIQPTALMWYVDPTSTPTPNAMRLLIAERLSSVAPTNNDRVKMVAESGTFVKVFTPVGDPNLHVPTALHQVAYGFASCDMDGDGDVDLKDIAAYLACAKNPSSSCLGVFDDDQTGNLSNLDTQVCIARMAGPPFPCTSNPQCNDANPCTTDTCVSSVCQHAIVADGTACTDSTFCDGSEVCRGGVCSGIPPCVDGPHCDEAGDRCRQCVSASECNDNNVCTTDSCNASGNCVHTPQAGSCNDGNACTINDACSAGVCVGGGARNCNDNNVCTNDSCDPGAGCQYVHNDNFCDDNSICTTESRCLLGTCRGMNPIDCDDGNQCTTDFCDPIIGCRNLNSQLACDDHDACTTDEICNGAGQCIGVPLDCDDGIECTVDTCEDGVCVHTPDNAVCQDNLFCNGADACVAGVGCTHAGNPCAAGAVCQNTCNEAADSCISPVGTPCPADGNPCTNDVCNGSGVCGVNNNNACNDNNPCTTGDTCTNGSCVGTPTTNCAAAGDQCNTRSCSTAGAPNNCDIITPKANGTACNDGFFCTEADVCTGGVCGGPQKDCSSAGNQCNDGVCNEAADACQPQPKQNGTACNDGNACNVGETCQAGSCVGGGPVGCSGPTGSCDGGQSCNPANGQCQDNPDPAEGTACELDGDLCTEDECNGSGSCVTVHTETCASPTQCDGGGTCNPTTGACEGNADPAAGTACELDASLCTIDECDGAGTCVTVDSVTCAAPLGPCDGGQSCNPTNGMCEDNPHPAAGSPCNDGDACTEDECNGLGACLIVGETQCPGPSGPCDGGQTCNPATGACDDEPDPDGTPCDNDADACTVDLCDGSGSCVFDHEVSCPGPTGTCDAGESCNPANGQCVANDDPSGPCDTDMDLCTLEQCNGKGDCLPAGTVSCAGPSGPCDGGESCNSATGACDANADPAAGTACELDGSLCTIDECDGAGTCGTVDTVICAAPSQCDGGQMCNATTGACDNLADPAEGTACELDGNECTIDECNGMGACETVDTVTCPGPTGICDGGQSCNTSTGMCENIPDAPVGAACEEDGDLCTDEECNGAGACEVVDTVDCPGPTGPCDGGQSCNPANGMCQNDPDPAAGTPCNTDMNLCSLEQCNGSGACNPMGSVSCPGPSGCDGGQSCNPANGNCEDLPDPTVPCDDMNDCTVSDTCAAGVCVGTPRPAGTSCNDDQSLCTIDQCDGAGTCAFVSDLECADPTGPCDGGQTCSPASGCVEDPDPAGGTPCDNDSDLCTIDECDGAGNCSFVQDIVCADPTGDCDGGQFCNGMTGNCEDNPDVTAGTLCTDLDSDLCTIDECDGVGNCTNVGDVMCTEPQVCEPTTGLCEDPPP